MIRTFMMVATTVASLAFSPTGIGQSADHGTAAEAKAMLMKAVAAVKADKTKALEMFNAGTGGFRWVPGFPFLWRRSNAHAHPKVGRRAGGNRPARACLQSERDAVAEAVGGRERSSRISTRSMADRRIHQIWN